MFQGVPTLSSRSALYSFVFQNPCGAESRYISLQSKSTLSPSSLSIYVSTYTSQPHAKKLRGAAAWREGLFGLQKQMTILEIALPSPAPKIGEEAALLRGWPVLLPLPITKCHLSSVLVLGKLDGSPRFALPSADN